MSKRLVVKGGGLPLALGLVLLVLAVAATTWSVARQDRAASMVAHTLAVEAQLGQVLSLLQDAETGQRGYLLAADEAFLAPYQAAVTALDDELTTLRRTTADNPAQQATLSDLDGVVRQKVEELARTIAVRRAGDLKQAIALVRAGTGKALMDRARSLVGTMRSEEERLLAERQGASEQAGFWLQVGMAAAIILMTLIAVLAVRATVHRASLARFLPAELVPQLAAGDAGLRSGRRQRAAVLFIDMRGSTALAERMPPERLSVLLTSFRRRISSAAATHGGIVDKFVGDGALLVFGVPAPAADDAARALACGRHLVELIARWNAKHGFDPPIAVGVGIHVGEVFCGVLGDDSRLEFTVLGDTVNVASRLEQATKALGQPLLASQDVVAAARETASWREVSREPLPGRTEELAILAPMSAAGAAEGVS